MKVEPMKVGSNYLTVTKEKENKLREDEIGLSGPQAIFTTFAHTKLCRQKCRQKMLTEMLAKLLARL